MNNQNKEWLNSANSYRPEEGANRLADQINAEMQDLRPGAPADPKEVVDRLWKLHERCLELAPLAEPAPNPKPKGRTAPMGIGNEWAAASFNLQWTCERLREGEPLPDEVLDFTAQVAYGAASRTVSPRTRKKARDE